MPAPGNPLFTVIIPTKDRADYLHHTLRTCALQDYENFEVIVSDDGSTDHTREVVEAAARLDPRIRYVSPGVGVGMRDNFEFALNQVRPGFVLALGGDDGLLPYGVRGMHEVLRETGRELLAWPAPIFSYPKAKMETGQLVLHRYSGRRVIPSNAFLERQTKHLYYVNDPESPMFYVKGVTSTRLVDRVRSRSADGRFYGCATPDGYSGIVLAGEVEDYAFSGEPFSIFGTSPTSQGLGYLANDESAKQQSEKFFNEVAQRPMHEELARQPYSPLITLMTVDYLLTARDLPGWPGTFPPIDYERVLLNSLMELAHGLYGEGRVIRELGILAEIAEHQQLGSIFRKQVGKMRRFQSKAPFEGNGISTRQLFLDCSMLGIQNVFDAAYVAHYYAQIKDKMTTSVIFGMLKNSISYRLKSMRMGDRFPDESHWSKTSRAQSK
ncbi:MAG: glycosyltransferase family 2 protein [Acidobacteria bacterium]|nr:glycosyltransferase family 2 protein [Acidobacteriota bacterium]